MMRLLFLVLITSIHAPKAATANAVVRGGEHGTFTRITISNTGSEKWKFSRQDEDFSILFENTSVRIDATRVFDRISRDRIDSYSVDGSRISFKLNCDCVAQPKALDGSLIFIDIFESEEQIADPESDNLRETTAEPDLSVLSNYFRNSEGVKRPSVAVNTIEIEALEFPSGQLDYLAQRLSRTATTGILKTTGKSPKKPTENIRNLISHDGMKGSQSINLGFDNESHEMNIEAPQLPGKCEAELTALFSHDQDGYNLYQFGAARSGLSNDDRIQEAELSNHILWLISMGLGAEALSFIKSTEVATTEMELATILAMAVEYGEHVSIQDQELSKSCKEEFPIISILTDRNNDGMALDTQLLVKQFYQISDHLKKGIAPTLVKKLLDSGREDVAKEINRALQRILGHETENSLTSTRLDNETGNPSNARQAMERIVLRPSSDARAVADMISDEVLDQEFAPSEGSIGSLEHFAFIETDSPEGLRLAEAAAVAKARAGRFDEALDDLLNAEQRFGGFQKNTLSTVLDLLHSETKDSDFTFLATVALTNWAEEMERETRDRIADRLNSIGLISATQLDQEERQGEDPLAFSSVMSEGEQTPPVNLPLEGDGELSFEYLESRPNASSSSTEEISTVTRDGDFQSEIEVAPEKNSPYLDIANDAAALRNMIIEEITR